MIFIAAAVATHAVVTGTPLYVYLYYAVAIVGGLAAIVGGFWKLVLPSIKRLNNFFTDWEGEDARPGVPAQPGVMMRLEVVELDVKSIKHEVHLNSGESLKDRVLRTQNQVKELHDKMNEPEPNGIR